MMLIEQSIDMEPRPGTGASMKRTSFALILPLLIALSSAFCAHAAQTRSGLLDHSARQAAPPIPPGALRLTPREIKALTGPRAGAVINLPSIDRFTGNTDTPLNYRPFDLLADGASIRVIQDGVEFDLQPPERRYYLAGNATMGIGLAVDSVNGAVTGFAVRGGDRTEIRGALHTQLDFSAVTEPAGSVNSCGNTRFDMRGGAAPDREDLGRGDSFMPSGSAALAGEAISYQAVVAIDTDAEWLEGFNNDTDAALDWITELFLAMNVFFERDVETQLLLGDTTLRVDDDPYTEPNNRFAQLDEFGAWWSANMGQVERQFAAMLSGRSISSRGFSGIAWVGQYCATGRNWGGSTVGSYSYNAIGSLRTPGGTALYVGHELGHNMGSPHTHCYDPPVDYCYNGDSSCFTGTPECPAAGRGTIMSYCHMRGSNGADCGESRSEFHPIVQGLLENRLAYEMVQNCILPYSPPVDELIFSEGFED